MPALDLRGRGGAATMAETNGVDPVDDGCADPVTELEQLQVGLIAAAPDCLGYRAL